MFVSVRIVKIPGCGLLGCDTVWLKWLWKCKYEYFPETLISTNKTERCHEPETTILLLTAVRISRLMAENFPCFLVYVKDAFSIDFFLYLLTGSWCVLNSEKCGRPHGMVNWVKGPMKPRINMCQDGQTGPKIKHWYPDCEKKMLKENDGNVCLHMHLYVQGGFLLCRPVPRLCASRQPCVACCEAHANQHAWRPITFGMKGSSYLSSQITGGVENAVPLHVDFPSTGGRSSAGIFGISLRI
jgi:hypothetical protein